MHHENGSHGLMYMGFSNVQLIIRDCRPKDPDKKRLRRGRQICERLWAARAWRSLALQAHGTIEPQLEKKATFCCGSHIRLMEAGPGLCTLH